MPCSQSITATDRSTRPIRQTSTVLYGQSHIDTFKLTGATPSVGSRQRRTTKHHPPSTTFDQLEAFVDDDVAERHREYARRTREHDQRCLQQAGLTQGPNPYPDMNWPPITAPGSLTVEQAHALAGGAP